MKRMMMLMVAVACMGVVALPVVAEEGVDKKPMKVKKVKAPIAKKVKGEKKPKPVLEDIIISGVIAKVEKTGKDDKVVVQYVITDGEGNKISLPKLKKSKKKGDEAAFNIEDYLDAGVKVIGKGIKVEKKGKTIVMLKQVTRIEKGGGVTDVEVFPAASE